MEINIIEQDSSTAMVHGRTIDIFNATKVLNAKKDPFSGKGTLTWGCFSQQQTTFEQDNDLLGLPTSPLTCQ